MQKMSTRNSNWIDMAQQIQQFRKITIRQNHPRKCDRTKMSNTVSCRILEGNPPESVIRQSVAYSLLFSGGASVL